MCSQFFFTLAPAPKCDGKHVVLGKVMDGLHILKQIGEFLLRPGVAGHCSRSLAMVIVRQSMSESASFA